MLICFYKVVDFWWRFFDINIWILKWNLVLRIIDIPQPADRQAKTDVKYVQCRWLLLCISGVASIRYEEGHDTRRHRRGKQWQRNNLSSADYGLGRASWAISGVWGKAPIEKEIYSFFLAWQIVFWAFLYVFKVNFCTEFLDRGLKPTVDTLDTPRESILSANAIYAKI